MEEDFSILKNSEGGTKKQRQNVLFRCFALFFWFSINCSKIKIVLDNSTTFSGYHLIGNTNLTCRSYPLRKGSCFNSHFVSTKKPAGLLHAVLRCLWELKSGRLSSVLFKTAYGGFLKWWYPTTMGFPTKNAHFGVFWGYHHLRKHPHHFHRASTVLVLQAPSLLSSRAMKPMSKPPVTFVRKAKTASGRLWELPQRWVCWRHLCVLLFQKVEWHYCPSGTHREAGRLLGSDFWVSKFSDSDRPPAACSRVCKPQKFVEKTMCRRCHFFSLAIEISPRSR